MRAQALIAVLSTLLVLPGAAAASVRFESRDELLLRDDAARASAVRDRVLPARKAPFRFNLIGLHWRGGGEVWFRTARARDGWGPWLAAAPESEDLPDRGTREARIRAGWRLGNPHWTGPAAWVQYRTAGRVTSLRAHFVWSPLGLARRTAIAVPPEIIPRSAWGADESITRAPYYAEGLSYALVHHTAGRNDYTPAESAAIVRAIQVYHVKGNGWNDIGYNFLVDRYGQVFEGRAGGVEANVVGAHAEGFNRGSAGVAILGSYDGEGSTSEAQSALVALLSWRLDLAHVDPLSLVDLLSGGNARFPAGAPVLLRAVSGHRDTGLTACPGDFLYAQLPAIGQAVAATGLPKLYAPGASSASLVRRPDGTFEPIRFGARLSEALTWTVAIANRVGAVVASGSGTGEQVDWTWDGRGPDGLPVPAAEEYTATITAGSDVQPAALALAPALISALVEDLRARPQTLTPNGDGEGEATAVTFSLAAASNVSVHVQDAAGQLVATLLAETPLAAGPVELPWAGVGDGGGAAPDGHYQIVVTASGATGQTARAIAVVVDRALGGLRAAPLAFSPNGDGRLDRLALAFGLAREAHVRVRLRRRGRWVARPFAGTLAAGSQAIVWDGTTSHRRVRDGTYLAVVEVTTDLGTRRLARRVTLDTTPPRLTIRSAWSRRGATKLSFVLGEPARIKVWTDGGASVVERPPGAGGFFQRAETERARLIAWDAAGNATGPIAISVRR